MNGMEIILRAEPMDSDPAAAARLCRLAGNFSEEEIRLAEELVRERLTRGLDSGYFFRFAQERGQVRGYVCFGPIPGTESSWDLYWLVVDPGLQRRGLGALLLREAEREASGNGALRIYVDTSSRPDYKAARSHYFGLGYKPAAVLKDFYRLGDDKIIFEKILQDPAA